MLKTCTLFSYLYSISIIQKILFYCYFFLFIVIFSLLLFYFFPQYMFPKKILFLVGGYIAWNVVHALYNKKQTQVKKIQKKEDIQMLAKNFLMTQKEFLKDVEDKILSEKNKESLQTKKEEFHNFAKKYISEGEKIFSELQESKEYKNIKTQWVSLFSKLSHSVSSLWEDIKQKTSQSHPSEEIIESEEYAKSYQEEIKTPKTVQKSTKVSAKKVTKK